MTSGRGTAGRGWLVGLAGALAMAGWMPTGMGKGIESRGELAVTPAFTAAMADAKSADPARHEDLLARLGRLGFLAELDTRSDLADGGRLGLHASRVVEALAQNPADSARSAFLGLLGNRSYLSEDARVDGLIRASVHLRPAPPALVTFWSRYSRPHDGFTAITMATLVGNGSPAALDLFARKLLDAAHDVDAKTGWLRGSIPNHRNEPALLKTCERLLRGKLPARLQAELVDGLFDERVPGWLLPATASTYAPPALETASPQALNLLIGIGELALAKVKLRDEQRAFVKARVTKAKALLGP